ncbi:unnamed protein product [Allacma fusca]|uniref:RHD domain-containing protein n=1 Tax=Allacma fusca TaxID=39272 RepID=A0A8J2KKQ8_9HEXA|nr:unnamed protein product [Allacma fusca]
MEDYSRVYVKLLEEPAPKALRFRYECEGRSAGSLPGANSTHDKKTFPKIQIVGYKGRAVVVVSCVTVDPPYRPHPHNLVGKEGCKKGVCTLEISNDDMTCEFSNLGIQCVKKKDIDDSLRIREEIRVDPFRTGFSHKTQPGSIDLNSVRLCFQVFLQGPERGQFKIPVKAVVSEPIYDKKAISDLTIMKLSDCASPVIGNKEIILLCDKVSKDDIEVRFFEENNDGQLIWEAFGDFQPSDVHKQFAISFRTPQYHQLEIDSPRRVQVQLRCPSKDTVSLPRPFDYIPLHTGKFNLKAYNLLNSVDSAHNVFEDNKMEQEPLPEDEVTVQDPNFENVFDNEDAYKVLNEFLVNVASGQVNVEPGISPAAAVEEDFYGSFELAMKNPVIDSQDHVNITSVNANVPSNALESFSQNGNLNKQDEVVVNNYLNQAVLTQEPVVVMANLNESVANVQSVSIDSNINANTAEEVSMTIQRNPNDPPPRPPKVPLPPRGESPPPPIPKRTKKSKDSFFKSLFSSSPKSPKGSPTKTGAKNKGSKPNSPTSPKSNISNDSTPMDQENNLECVEQFALYVERGQDIPKARIEEFYE